MLGGKNVSREEWERALRSADKSGDGMIDIIEFKGIFQSMVDKQHEHAVV